MFYKKRESRGVQIIQAFVVRRHECREWNTLDLRGTVIYMDIDDRFRGRNVQRWRMLDSGRHGWMEKLDEIYEMGKRNGGSRDGRTELG